MTRRPHPSSGYALLTIVLVSAACSDDRVTASETGEPCEATPPPPESLPELDAGYALTEDVDGDGHVDLVMDPFQDSEAPPTVRWGSADGELGAAQELPFTSLGAMRTDSLTLADLDGDGDLEVLRVSWDIEVDFADTQARIEVAMQSVARTFESPVSSEPEGLGRVQVIGVDLDGDGVDELAGATSEPETSLLTIPNDGPSFDAPVPGVTTAWLYVRQLAAVDLDGDGREELVAHGRPPDGDTTTPTLLVASSDADLTLAEAGEYAAGSDPGSSPGNLSLGDFDGDGHLDLCVVNSRDLSVLRGLEGVAFAEHQILAFPELAEGSECESCNLILHTHAGDFDGDGVDELAVSLVVGGAWIVDDVLAETPTLVPLEQRGTNVADLDGDDCDDILAADIMSNGPFGTTAEWTLYGCPLGSCE